MDNDEDWEELCIGSDCSSQRVDVTERMLFVAAKKVKTALVDYNDQERVQTNIEIYPGKSIQILIRSKDKHHKVSFQDQGRVLLEYERECDHYSFYYFNGCALLVLFTLERDGKVEIERLDLENIHEFLKKEGYVLKVNPCICTFDERTSVCQLPFGYLSDPKTGKKSLFEFNHSRRVTPKFTDQSIYYFTVDEKSVVTRSLKNSNITHTVQIASPDFEIQKAIYVFPGFVFLRSVHYLNRGKPTDKLSALHPQLAKFWDSYDYTHSLPSSRGLKPCLQIIEHRLQILAELTRDSTEGIKYLLRLWTVIRRRVRHVSIPVPALDGLDIDILSDGERTGHREYHIPIRIIPSQQYLTLTVQV